MNSRGGVVVVLGASSGIGSMLADALGRWDNRITVVRMARWARTAKPEDEPRTYHVRVDATDTDAVQRDVGTIERDIGPIRLAVCAAGDFTSTDPFAHYSEVDRLLRANLAPWVNLCNSVAPFMVSRRTGRLVVVGSGWSLVPVAGVAAYAASKAAVTSHALCTGSALQSTGVSVSVLFPGYAPDTHLVQRAVTHGLRPPPPFLRTSPRKLRAVAERLLEGEPEPVIHLNPLERLAGALSALAPGLLHRVVEHTQPFPTLQRNGTFR